MTSFLIMTFDGGGVFGRIPSRFLRHYGDLLTEVNMFAGTSVGSHLALGLAIGRDPMELYSIADTSMSNIFKKRFPSIIRPIFGPRYKDTNLVRMLQRELPGELNNHHMKFVAVPAHNLANDSYKVYDNLVDHDDIGTPLWRIARESSAAPTYFSPYNGMVDGGWSANNPSIDAFAAAINKLHIKPANIRLLSMGTGHPPPTHYDSDKMEGWGAMAFLKPLISSVTKASEQRTEFIMDALQHQLQFYRRFDPVELDVDWTMDDPNNSEEIDRRVDEHMQEFDKVIRQFVQRDVSL